MTRAGRLSRQEVAKLPVASPAELLLSVQLEQAGIPFEREVLFDSERKWRADFRIQDWSGISPILIEVEGGIWSGGRHVRGLGFAEGCVKQAHAVILGYRYLRVTTEQVENGDAYKWVRAALGLEAA